MDSATTYLTRVDAGANMRRFYRIEITADLFGGRLLVREWGRIGARGQRLCEWFADDAQAQARMARIAGQKQRRGYAPA